MKPARGIVNPAANLTPLEAIEEYLGLFCGLSASFEIVSDRQSWEAGSRWTARARGPKYDRKAAGRMKAKSVRRDGSPERKRLGTRQRPE